MGSGKPDRHSGKQGRSIMSAIARRGHILLLLAVCCGVALADMHAGRSASAPETIGSTAAPLTQDTKSGDFSVPQLGGFATDLRAQNSDALGKRYSSSTMSVADISAKWNELQSRLLADEAAVSACRTSAAACTLAARQFLSIVDIGAQRDGRVRFGWVNRAVNMAIRPASDWSQYGVADFWASPLQTLGSGAGDCEDYAIVKYVVLRELGITADDLRLIIVQDEKRETGHAVVAVRHEQRWLILDNRTMAILDAEDVHDYRPLFALDQHGTQTIATASIDLITNR